MTRQLITRKAAAERFTLSTRQLDRMREAGIGPMPIKVSAKRYAYFEAEVDAYIAELATERQSVAS